MNEVPRRCARVRRRLPLYARDELSWWRRRLVARHLGRCDACAAQLARELAVLEQLELVGEQAEESLDDVAPPDDLLETLLDQARDPNLRQRVAVPARGAVSGARPGLSVALVATIVALVALAGWAGWRLGRSWRNRRDAADGAPTGAG